ncbi:HAMP domain-containing protein [Acetobacter sp. AN02]|nr:ATP-binding protein [Acetobacter sp. AN02]MDG6094436.1 HAMP domain-containing protein [Acetobacter sp. AN02]
MRLPGFLRYPARYLQGSLAARTSVVLIIGFAVIEIAGLTIEAMDRITFDHQMAEHQAMSHALMSYRTLAETPENLRASIVDTLDSPGGFDVSLKKKPDPDLTERIPFGAFSSRLFWALPPRPFPGEGFPPPSEGHFPYHRPDFHSENHHFPPFSMPPEGMPGDMQKNLRWHPKEIRALSRHSGRKRALAFLLPDEPLWVQVDYTLPRATPFSSPTFPLAFALMTTVGGALIIGAVRRLVAPVGTLAAAAEALVPDDNAPPLPENGPPELARAAAAFNAMATRIRKFVSDRTLVLTSIGHDLRTPITRMKLRAEFIEDDDIREKFLSDLNDLATMVDATLSYGSASSSREPVVFIDLHALLQTIADDISESRSDAQDNLFFDDSDTEGKIFIRGRPVALKRAFTNLIVNALNYGGNARISLIKNPEGSSIIRIDDDGPGLPQEELDRMFEPFVRAEKSRSRETGGTGLGLSISRTIFRGHGGDVVLENRSPHGLRATVTLP